MVINKFRKHSEKNVIGGNGTVDFTYLAEGGMLGKDKVRAYNLITIHPGGSIGYHCHKGEAEISYFLEGQAKVIVDLVEYEAVAGELAYCPNGHYHSIENISSVPLKILALVIYE